MDILPQLVKHLTLRLTTLGGWPNLDRLEKVGRGWGRSGEERRMR